jgi:hypothetical protein
VSGLEFVKAPGPCSLDRSAKHNWVEDAGGLPNYICQVARGVARGGKSLDASIPIAVATIKKWAAGGGDVSAAVRARAAEAVAAWEALKAKAHAKNASSVEEVPLTPEDEAFAAQLEPALLQFAELRETLAAAPVAPPEHGQDRKAAREKIVKQLMNPPEKKKGSRTGGNSTEARSKRAYGRDATGKFAPGQARDANAAASQKVQGAQKLYSDIVANGGDKKYLKGLSDGDLTKATRILYSEKTSDPKVVAARNAIAAEMARRGYDVKDYGAKGGGIDSDKKAPEDDKKAPEGKTPKLPPGAEGLPPVPGGGVDVEKATDAQIEALKKAGWKGKPDDKREAMYPPTPTALADTKAEFTPEEPVDKTIIASAAEWADTYSYYWDPDLNVTYRVGEAGVEEFTSNDKWISAEATESEVESLPTVDDQETLEAIVGAALAGEDTKTAVDPEAGRKFKIPLLIPEGVPSGDRRTFTQGALEFKEPPSSCCGSVRPTTATRARSSSAASTRSSGWRTADSATRRASSTRTPTRSRLRARSRSGSSPASPVTWTSSSMSSPRTTRAARRSRSSTVASWLPRWSPSRPSRRRRSRWFPRTVTRQ